MTISGQYYVCQEAYKLSEGGNDLFLSDIPLRQRLGPKACLKTELINLGIKNYKPTENPINPNL